MGEQNRATNFRKRTDQPFPWPSSSLNHPFQGLVPHSLSSHIPRKETGMRKCMCAWKSSQKLCGFMKTWAWPPHGRHVPPLPGRSVPASQQQVSAHSLLVYFISISTCTKSVNHFYILVPQDIKHIHLHKHFQMCNVSLKDVVKTHEILLLNNNELCASWRPHYTLQIFSKW